MTKRPFLIGGGVLLTLIVGIALAAFLFSDDLIRNVVGGKGSSALGRDLSINGPLNINWNWRTPSVHAEDIRLSNLPGSDEPDMVHIETLDFNIRIWKLLLGRLELPEVRISKPKIVLEKRDADTNNWDLPALSKGNAAAETVMPDDRSNFPLIGLLEIRDGTFVYKDSVKNLTLDLKLDTVSGQGGGDEDGQFKLAGDGSLQDKPFKLDASGGSLFMLRDTSKPYPLTFDLQMGATSVRLNGTFTDPVKLTGVDTTLDLKGDNLADLFYLTGIPLPPTPAYSLIGRLKKDSDIWAFEDFKGKVGGSDLNGNLTYDTGGERGFIRAVLSSSVLDVKDLGGFIGATPAEDQKQDSQNRLLPDMPLNLTRLRAADMDVVLKAGKLNAPGLPMDTLDVRFDLKDGILKLNPLAFGLAGGTVKGNLTLNGQKDVPHVAIDLILRRLSLKQFFSDSRFEDFSQGRFGGHIKVAGDGRSLADVLAVSNGRIVFVMGGGSISRLIIEAAGLDIGEAMPLILGKDDTTAIRCGVGDFTVTQGILQSQVFVFDTEDTNIQGQAAINLRDETITAKLEANPKDMSILAVRTPLTLSGKLNSPNVGIAPIEAGIKGAAALALGVLFPPAAAIPFIEFGFGEDSDCRGLIQAARAKSKASVN